MAHTGIFATSDEIILKAGAGASATATTEARINALCKQVESYINTKTRTNYSDTFSALNIDVQGILTEAESNLVAIYLITFDLSGFTTRVEAEDILNILKVRFNECMKTLSDQTAITFINKA